MSDTAQRPGQAAMNALRVAAPDLYERIAGTDADPFYDDSRLSAFFDRLTKVGEWQKREQAALRWMHEDAGHDPRGVGATVLLMLGERTTSGSRMTVMLFEAAEEFDALADNCGADRVESRYRELASRCREAAP